MLKFKTLTNSKLHVTNYMSPFRKHNQSEALEDPSSRAYKKLQTFIGR